MGELSEAAPSRPAGGAAAGRFARERTAFARRLRRDSTATATATAAAAERRRWQRLRGRGRGAKFRRQQALGRFTVDCACRGHRLVIELDGGRHAGSPADRARGAGVSGFSGFWNPEVMTNIDGVPATIETARRR